MSGGEFWRKHAGTFTRQFKVHFARGLGQGVGFAVTILLALAALALLHRAGVIR